MSDVLDEPQIAADHFHPGRSCPLSYRYSPESIATIDAVCTDTLYCVGGLYGNPYALHALRALLELERASTRVVFNGDFHWFDATPEAFSEIEAALASDARFARTRGNVETELASDLDTGCGCSYPSHVDEGVVNRSNEILRLLRDASRAHPHLREALGRLPMFAAYQVGSARVAVVHGDLESLAGWQLDPKSLANSETQKHVARQMMVARADVVASTHTCSPALRQFRHANSAGQTHLQTIINNGAAGMPNFSGTTGGLLTRISRMPAAALGIAARYSVTHNEVYVEAIDLAFDSNAWIRAFLDCWPAGSAAHTSYFSRIERGSSFTNADALGC